MKDIVLKIADSNVNKELTSIRFDSSYLSIAKNKYNGQCYKLFNIKPHEANILKQICLSLGFDCAVSRETIMCSCEYTDCLIFATNAQIDKLVKKLRVQPFRLKQIADLFQHKLKAEIEPLIIRNFIFNWSRPYIMGIVNCTPDSFSDGGKYNPVEQTLKLIEEGADIIDIGGESTRPDATVVSIEEEINRVIPVIKQIRQKGIDIPLSVDTRNFETAKLAIEAGADIINDVSGLDYDKNLYDYVAQNNIPVIIMHSNNVPATQDDFSNLDIVEQVYFQLNSKINKLVRDGMERKNIIIDIGIGFGKSKDSNFELLRRLREFDSLNVPMLLGISRKSFIRNEFNLNCDDADIPTALYSALLNNVNIHRVHNVQLTKQYLDFASKLV